MSNTLTAVMPIIYEAMDTVSREIIGFIPAVYRNSKAERAALNQVITYPVVPPASLEDITPGVNPADSGDVTVGSGTMTISRAKSYPIRWSGEEEQALKNGDNPQLQNIMRDQFTQAFRTIANAVEADLATTFASTSRAYGTAAQAPFGTAGDLSDIAQLRKILTDNGAPLSELQFVMNTTAGANMRGKQNVLFKVNESGTDQLLRQGIIGRLEGFDMHESAGIVVHTKGTGTGYLHDETSQPAGSSALHIDTGTGTVLAGDVVTFAGDTSKYIIGTGTGGDGDQDIALNKPGLQSALADDVAMTIGGSFTPNMGFAKSAIHLVTRLPAMPDGGDRATDVTTITDPVSGLVFEIASYPEYRRRKIEVCLCWGWKAVKSEHISVLLG